MNGNNVFWGPLIISCQCLFINQIYNILAFKIFGSQLR